ncbi:Uma2 family endonuclease [Candidatus Venteria ishoeyi]|uniref:Putative restriction endonuclease domain-containing protein n=1 Tax=Candidatus Venteria ishoeyi TaxID=1899563 RepID=A0A1H6FAZ7_9GAMM|nr:Uma2 family endonuclease [Candidatus Venteria ishoeyi]SEH06204.1 Uncharacterised protein [Candidatus Venteria ishoeyi]
MLAQTGNHPISFQEYLELEARSEEKHEYHQGEIFPMAGASLNHNQIIGQLYMSLYHCLQQQKQGKVFMNDVKLHIENLDKATYPDLMVFMQAIEYADKKHSVVSNPSLIIEVLSQSTADYDHGAKFSAYRSLPGFQEYLLVDQYQIRLEHYVKTAPHEWIFREYSQPDAEIQLVCLDCKLNPASIYCNMEFEPPG